VVDLLARLQAALGDRYTIEHELGRGAMAIVYLAQDLKHRRQVALKVLQSEVGAAIGADRFLREIEIAARLSHPHIVPLFDSGDAAGFLFYAMPYIAGETLRRRLQRERQLAVDDALRITREVGSALDYAHRNGIVHRDIKPENILLADGQAVVADFGIARAIVAAGGIRITLTGLLVGTPAYMSPEQASGETELDGRSDIYSLGCVLYEMLAGEAPHTGASAQAVIAKRLGEPVPHVRTLRDVPDAIEQAVTKALAKMPADRFVTAVEFAQALVRRTPTTPTRASIAVLPFANLGADPENDYFSDGMTEEIINALAQMPGLRVAARTSSFAFKSKNRSIRALGEELQVSTVLEGSVRRWGTSLRITAQLSDVQMSKILWSERYDREMADVFAIQDDIAKAIVDRLKGKLLGGEQAPLVKRGTTDLEAYHQYLRGRHFWYQRILPKAIACFEQAIAKDPNYALAYAGLADAVAVLGFYGFCPSQYAYARCKEAAERALALDPGLADAHYSQGLMELYYGWNLRASEQAFRRAIALNPLNAMAHVNLGLLLSYCARFDEAMIEAHRAQEIEPLSQLVSSVAGGVYCQAHHYPEAIEACEAALEIDPNWGTALWCLSMPYGVLGRYDEAIALLQRAAVALQQSPMILLWLGGVYAKAGRSDEAAKVLAELKARSANQFVPALAFAWIHLWQGDLDQGVEYLARAFEERNAVVYFVGSWLGLEHLQADPRYVDLLRRAGLETLIASPRT
jgi:serine/threonine-protein kinase